MCWRAVCRGRRINPGRLSVPCVGVLCAAGAALTRVGALRAVCWRAVCRGRRINPGRLSVPCVGVPVCRGRRINPGRLSVPCVGVLCAAGSALTRVGALRAVCWRAVCRGRRINPGRLSVRRIGRTADVTAPHYRQDGTLDVLLNQLFCLMPETPEVPESYADTSKTFFELEPLFDMTGECGAIDRTSAGSRSEHGSTRVVRANSAAPLVYDVHQGVSSAHC